MKVDGDTIHRPQPGGLSLKCSLMALLPGAAPPSETLPGYYFPEGERPFWEGPWDILDAFIPEPIQWLWDIVAETPNVSVPPVIEEVPEGWETVVIGGVERVRVPDIYAGPEPVLEPFDPDVVVGEVQGADTAEQEDEVVAHDWGHLAREFLGGVGSSLLNGSAPTTYAPPASDFLLPGSTAAQVATTTARAAGDCDGMTWSGGTPPKGYKVVNYCGQGVLRKVRRRRRRRLLTRGDSQDIATIVGLVGKGQMASALINRRT